MTVNNFHQLFTAVSINLHLVW